MKETILREGNITIIPGVQPENFAKVSAFNVYIECDEPYRGTDKELMQEVCQFLTKYVQEEIELRTQYVVSSASFEQGQISKILFQVITPLELMWYC